MGGVLRSTKQLGSITKELSGRTSWASWGISNRDGPYKTRLSRTRSGVCSRQFCPQRKERSDVRSMRQFLKGVALRSRTFTLALKWQLNTDWPS